MLSSLIYAPKNIHCIHPAELLTFRRSPGHCCGHGRLGSVHFAAGVFRAEELAVRC